MCPYTVGSIEWDGFVNCSPRPDCEELAKQGRRIILYFNRAGAELRVVPQDDQGSFFAGWVIAIERTKGSGWPIVIMPQARHRPYSRGNERRRSLADQWYEEDRGIHTP